MDTNSLVFVVVLFCFLNFKNPTMPNLNALSTKDTFKKMNAIEFSVFLFSPLSSGENCDHPKCKTVKTLDTVVLVPRV